MSGPQFNPSTSESKEYTPKERAYDSLKQEYNNFFQKKNKSIIQATKEGNLDELKKVLDPKHQEAHKVLFF